MKDGDIFTIDHYIALSPDQRNLLDAWLKKSGGEPPRTKELRVEGCDIIAVEYYTLSDGKLLYDQKKKSVVFTERLLKVWNEPPIWIKDVPEATDSPRI